MEIAIRNIGNSKGVVLPKPLLAQAGLEDQITANITVENGQIILSKPAKAVRAGWSEAAAAVAAQGDDAMLMGEFGIVDAFYAPVCSRIRTYGLPVNDVVKAYVDRVLALPAVQAWYADALLERDFLPFEEPYRSAPEAHHKPV